MWIESVHSVKFFPSPLEETFLKQLSKLHESQWIILALTSFYCEASLKCIFLFYVIQLHPTSNELTDSGLPMLTEFIKIERKSYATIIPNEFHVANLRTTLYDNSNYL
jgi:hypothetical protein